MNRRICMASPLKNRSSRLSELVETKTLHFAQKQEWPTFSPPILAYFLATGNKTLHQVQIQNPFAQSEKKHTRLLSDRIEFPTGVRPT